MQTLELDPKLYSLFNTKCRYSLLTSGRGPGKSHGVGTFIADLTYQPGHRILYTRWTMKSAELSIIPEFMDKVNLFEDSGHMAGARQHFRHLKSDDMVLNTVTGSDVIFRGMRTSMGNQTAALRSLKDVTTWVIEEAEELVDEDIFDDIDNSIRKTGIDLRVIIIWNPSHKKHWIWKRFFKDRNLSYDFAGEVDDTNYIYLRYQRNMDNLAASFIEKAERLKRVNIERYRHIYEGQPTDENVLALWKQKTMIDPYRVKKAPDLKSIAVGVDPNVTDKDQAKKQKIDDCGIITGGLGYDNHYYIIADDSGSFGPSEWGKRSVAAYKNYEAQMIVPEVNNGGDLVKANIKLVDPGVPVFPVRASRGKTKRADPIAALYEEGKVHHVGFYPELEDEMTTYTGLPPSAANPSPNRLDALVWVLWYLSQKQPSIPGIRVL